MLLISSTNSDRAVFSDFQDQSAIGKKSKGLVISIDLVLPVGEDDASRIHTDENTLVLLGCARSVLLRFV